MYPVQIFIDIEPADLIDRVKVLKEGGYRLVQICATKVAEGIETIHSFDKDDEMTNLRMVFSDDTEIQSISNIYWPAFIYENEMHDLFGIDIKHNVLDYGGHFFKVSSPAPWNPKKAEKAEGEVE